MVRELYPIENYRGTPFHRVCARANRIANSFRIVVPRDIYDIFRRTSNPDVCMDAYVAASVKHQGQPRLDGRDYIEHIDGTIKILADAGIVSPWMMVAGSLHDLVEAERDQLIGRERRRAGGRGLEANFLVPLEIIEANDRRCLGYIKGRFGYEIAEAVRTLTPLQKMHYTEEEREGFMYEQFRAIPGFDLRVPLIKLADGSQNLQPKEVKPWQPEKAIAYAEKMRRLLRLFKPNILEFGEDYSVSGVKGIQEALISPLERRIEAVIRESEAKLAEQRRQEREAVLVPGLVPASY